MRSELRASINARARELLYKHGVPWQQAIKQADREHRCEAKCKQSGRPCPCRPALGKKRCRVHGGLTPPRTPEQKARQAEISTKTEKRLARDERGRWVKLH